MAIQLAIAALISFLIGAYMFGIGNEASGIITHTRILFFTVVTQGFSAMALVNSFPAEKTLMLRERMSGMYCTSAWFVAKATVDAFRHCLSPIVFSATFYYMVPLDENVGRFFIFMSFMILTRYAAMAVVLLVTAICKTTAIALVVLPFILEAFRLASGFFVPPSIQKTYWKWLDHLS